MAKKRSARRLLPALGCLVLVGGLVAAGIALAPRVRSFFTGATSPASVQPYYGPSQGVAVRRGDVSQGVRAYGSVKASRQAKMAFEVTGGEVAASTVSVGMPVTEGQILVELDRKPLERDLAKARADLLAAQDKLEELEAGIGSAAERLRLEAELAAAKQKLDDAHRALADYDAGSGTPEERRARTAQKLAEARAELEALVNSKERREEIENLQWVYNKAEVKHGEMVVIKNPSEQDRDTEWLLRLDMLDKLEQLEKAKRQYEADKRDAQYGIDSAQAELELLDAQIANGLAAVERAKLASEVKDAEASVAGLQEELASLEQGVPTVDLAKARAEVLKAEGAVRKAEAALASCTLVAPFDGLITEGEVVPGQRVSVGTSLVTIEDPSSLRIIAQVSDVDIGRIEPDMDVYVSFDAMMGQEPLAGRVGEIPLYGKFENGMTIFEIPIEFPEGEQVPLFQGMSANVVFAMDVKQDVLVVPAAALFADDGGDYVLVVSEGAGVPEKRYVSKGISDGIYTEIVSGVSEGEIVSMPIVGPYYGPGMYY